jgi:hypothetical protein
MYIPIQNLETENERTNSDEVALLAYLHRGKEVHLYTWQSEMVRTIADHVG